MSHFISTLRRPSPRITDYGDYGDRIRIAELGRKAPKPSVVGDALFPSRHIGASVAMGDEIWSAKGGVFSTSPQDRRTAPFIPGSAQYWDLAGRLTYAPSHTQDTLVHLGVSGRYHRPNGSTGASDDRGLLVGSGVNSEANVLGINLLGTPDLSCSPAVMPTGFTPANLFTAQLSSTGCLKHFVTGGVEAAAAYGPFSIQAEYAVSHYERDPLSVFLIGNTGGALPPTVAPLAPGFGFGGASADFSGYYVYGSLFLTGESRAKAYAPYTKDWETPGVFHQISINHPLSQGGIGAWEVAARFSELNLNNGGPTGVNYLAAVGGVGSPLLAGFPVATRQQLVALSNGGIIGGREQNVTLGMNWYPEKGFRLMANWTQVLLAVAPWDRPWINGRHPNIFLMRAQVDW